MLGEELMADTWRLWARDAETYERSKEQVAALIGTLYEPSALLPVAMFRQFGAEVGIPSNFVVLHHAPVVPGSDRFREQVKLMGGIMRTDS